MNKLLKSFLLGIVATFLVAGSAMATPVYVGDTAAPSSLTEIVASVGDNYNNPFGNPDLPIASGYYIWSNDLNKTSWSVRWTDNNNDVSTSNEAWYGTVDFVGNDMTTLNAVAWDNSDGDEPLYMNAAPYMSFEVIGFSAIAGPHWDGFDFTIDPSAEAGRLRFNLGGSLYSDLELNDSDAGVAAYAMWIGDGNVMNVNIATTTEMDPNYIYQSFETPAPVPEPATMMLFGIGLLGLAGITRKKTQA